jgi:hypothetical protein
MKEILTCILPTSPIPSHPSASIVEQVIKSIRYHLPDCHLIIQADGVRPEQEKFRTQYEMYLFRLQESINAGKFGPCDMVRFPEFRHQAAMMKETIDRIRTPLLAYFEHDLMLLPEFIDWKGIAAAVLSKDVNQVRIYYWSSIIPEHQHLMVDREPVFVCGVPLIRTTQWSQHCQVASVEFYKWMLNKFSADCRTMIETFAYGVVAALPWEQTRCAIYAPMPYLKRIVHLHGREEEQKFEETFTF